MFKGRNPSDVGELAQKVAEFGIEIEKNDQNKGKKLRRLFERMNLREIINPSEKMAVVQSFLMPCCLKAKTILISNIPQRPANAFRALD